MASQNSFERKQFDTAVSLWLKKLAPIPGV